MNQSDGQPLAAGSPRCSPRRVELPLTPELRAELTRWRLAFCCEECLHFADEAEACDLLYPVQPHRRAAFERAPAGARLVFCRMFEAR